jgi:uncharacterized membrane protein
VRPWTDERLERTVADLLRTGVVLSALVVLGGGVCYLVRHGHDSVTYAAFHAEPVIYRTISGTWDASIHGNCPAVIQFGLLLLIATPIARVALSMAAFAMQKDRIYVGITGIVLVILLCALFGKY